MMYGAELRIPTTCNTLQVGLQEEKVLFWPSAGAVSASDQTLQVLYAYRLILAAYTLYDVLWDAGRRWARAHLWRAKKGFRPCIAQWQGR
jgi:hypothetical protein